MSPRETENNANSNFWGEKQRALWYVMVFSGVVQLCDSVCSFLLSVQEYLTGEQAFIRFLV